MGTLSIDVLKRSVLAKGYKWFDDQPMIVGIRTSIDVPDTFNDFLTISLTNSNYFKGYTATTDPGLYWLNNPANVKGTAILKEGQYINAYKIGTHGSSPITKHRALVQVRNVTVYRDMNRNSILDRGLITDTGLFGVNIHTTGSTLCGIPTTIGKWSAGCTVVKNNSLFQTGIMDVLAKFNTTRTDKSEEFTYTLLLEKDLLY